MKTSIAVLALTLAASSARAAAVPGRAAPAFSLPDQDGKTRSLADSKGKWVVLEWFNEGCPFVRKHYDTKNMQGLQKKWTGKGVHWFTVSSSKRGKQGHVPAAEAAARRSKEGMANTALLLDHDGAAGRAYGARTTPHVFVIDPKGTLAYAGAIDDKPGTDKDEVAGARAYVSAALEAGMAGKPVKDASTTPYGCSVKY